MKDYPPLPDGLPRVLSASSALTACPDSVCPVLDAPELEQLNGSSDRWIAGRLRRLPLRNEDNEPRRIRDLSAGYAEQGFELRRLGACCWQTVSPRLPKPVPPFWADGRPACR